MHPVSSKVRRPGPLARMKSKWRRGAFAAENRVPIYCHWLHLVWPANLSGTRFSSFAMDFSEYRRTRDRSPLRNSTRNANENDECPSEYYSHHYDSLPKKPGAIRILRLSPSSYDNPQIDCELITPKEDSEGKLSELKPYEALSWCWGTA